MGAHCNCWLLYIRGIIFYTLRLNAFNTCSKKKKKNSETHVLLTSRYENMSPIHLGDGPDGLGTIAFVCVWWWMLTRLMGVKNAVEDLQN